jgi:hypothetical protein
MQKMTGSASVLLVMASVGLVACSSDTKSLGTDDPADTTLSLEDFAASWDGYIEAYELPSTSDRVRIVLDEQGEGTVLFGDGEALAPPTDPDAAYPPQAANDEYMDRSVDSVYEQIAYPVHEGRLEDSRLRLEIHLYDAISDWCALQTPVYDEINDMYHPVPNTGGGMDETGCYYLGPNGEHVSISCAKVSLSNVCACTETACSINEGGPAVKLDGMLQDDGATLEGSIVFNSTPYTIRLARQ